MRRLLRDQTGTYAILPAHELRPGETALHFSIDRWALDFLRGLVLSVSNLVTLRLFLIEQGRHAQLPDRLLASDLCRILAHDLVFGRIKIVPPVRHRYPASQVKPREAGEEEDDEAPPSRLGPQEDLHWIAVRVVDDETDEPLSGVPLKIELPDGRVVTRKTGGDGAVHFSDLEDGTCSIVEMPDEDALEVVSVTATKPEG
jgi:hypothetical protein